MSTQGLRFSTSCHLQHSPGILRGSNRKEVVLVAAHNQVTRGEVFGEMEVTVFGEESEGRESNKINQNRSSTKLECKGCPSLPCGVRADSRACLAYVFFRKESVTGAEIEFLSRETGRLRGFLSEGVRARSVLRALRRKTTRRMTRAMRAIGTTIAAASPPAEIEEPIGNINRGGWVRREVRRE